MDKYNRLKDKFVNRDKIIGTAMLTFKNPVVLDMMNREELDFVIFDTEHGVFDTQNTVEMLQVCRLMGLPALVRAQDCEYHLIAKAIDMGADGVVVPRVERLEQLRTAVDALLFYPHGKKGVGGYAQFRRGENFADFKDTRFLLPQIESPEGIEMLPKMLEEYGEYISAIIVGPHDLSTMLGKPKDLKNPEFLECVQKVFDICNSYGKSCGIFCEDETQAPGYRAMGCNVLWNSVDFCFFKKGFDESMDAVIAIK